MYFILNMQNECEIFWKLHLNFHGFEFSDSRFSRNFMRRNQYGIKNQKLFHKHFDHSFSTYAFSIMYQLKFSGKMHV